MEGPPRKPPGASAKGGALLKRTDCVSIYFESRPPGAVRREPSAGYEETAASISAIA